MLLPGGEKKMKKYNFTWKDVNGNTKRLYVTEKAAGCKNQHGIDLSLSNVMFLRTDLNGIVETTARLRNALRFVFDNKMTAAKAEEYIRNVTRLPFVCEIEK